MTSRNDTYILLLCLLYPFIGLFSQETSHTYDDPRSSYLILPSAFAPAKGQVNIENIAIGYFGLDYGISDHLSLRASFELFNPIFAGQAPTVTISPKWTTALGDQLRVRLSWMHVIGFDDGFVSIPLGVVTYGSKARNLSLGYGHAFYNFFSVNTSYDGITVGGQIDVGEKWSLFTDNWILIGEPSDPFANDFDFFSAGFSFDHKRKMTISAGLVYFTEAEDLGNNPWPFIKISSDLKHVFARDKNRPVKPAKPKVKPSGPGPAKSIYVEGLGQAVYYSINFDSRFKKSDKNNGLGYRVGVGYLETVIVPVQLNYLIGRRHYLELGSGVTYAARNFDLGNGVYGDDNVSISSSIGYRFQALEHGLFFKLSVDYFYELKLSEDGATPWVGLGLGYKFK